MLIVGKHSEWLPLIEEARQRFADAEEGKPGRLSAGGIELEYQLLRQPAGLIGGDDMTYLLGNVHCRDNLLIVDAGGLTQQWNFNRISALIGKVQFKKKLDCSSL